MSGLPNIQENNEQVLNDIQSLQEMEQQLFNNLETNPNLTSDQQEKIIDKMNKLSNMRINLYQTLSGVNNFFQNALDSSIGTLKEQTVAVAIVESELNQSKKRLELLESEKNNKIRLVEINEYYGDKYAEHSQLMKIIIFILVPIIILAILNNKGILPNNIYYVLLVVISVIGAVFFWKKFAYMLMRDNMNYQEYNWYFDPNLATSGAATTSADPWLSTTSGSSFGTCIGQACCSSGQVYDSTSNQCVATTTATTTQESFETINNILTKQQPGKFKTDYDLSDNYKAPLSNSIINK